MVSSLSIFVLPKFPVNDSGSGNSALRRILVGIDLVVEKLFNNHVFFEEQLMALGLVLVLP